MMITLKQLSAPNSAFPNFLPTYTDDCAAVGSGQLITCVVTDSFVNKSNGNPPNSILKIVTTIENFDPDRRNSRRFPIFRRPCSTRPSATVRPSLSFKPRAAGRTVRVELLVRDDFGNIQGFDPVGTIVVAR